MEAETEEEGVAVRRSRGDNLHQWTHQKQESILWRGRWFLLVVCLMYMSWGPLFTFILLPCWIIAIIVGFSLPMINDEDPRTILLVKKSDTAAVKKSYYDYHQIFEKLSVYGNVSPSTIDENSLENESKFSPGQRIDTGHPKLDSELNEVLDLVFRDYLYSWYDKMLPQFLNSVNCEHEELFPKALRSVINHCTCEMVSRLKSANRMHPLVNFFTTDVIEELKSHVALFRLAEVKVPRAFRAQVDKEATEIRNNEVRAMFFDLEVSQYQECREQSVQARCRDFISQNDGHFTEYLRTVVDAIMLVTLPADEFRSRPVRYAVRELLISQVLKPTFDSMCSADFVNSCLIRYTPTENGVANGSVSSEAFVEMVKCSGSVEELDAIIAFAQEERTVLQTHDNLGNNMSTKKQLNSISYLIAECNARIDKLLNGPQNAMSAMSRMTSIVSSVTALNPLSQITTSASLHPMRIYEDEFEQYPDLSLYNLEGTSSHESKTSAAPSSGSNASLGSVATDFTPAINLTLGQILHSYHDEFFSYLEKLNASKFLQFYDYALAYKSTVDEVNSYRDERMMVNNVGGGISADRGDHSHFSSSSHKRSLYANLSAEEEHRVQSNMETMKHFAEYLLDAYVALTDQNQNSMQFNFKPDMSAVKELKQKLANKSLEPGFDWFEKMSKQTLNFMKTHPKLYPAYVNSKSYRNLFQTSATGETTASTGQNDSISTPGSPEVERRDSTCSSATLNVNDGNQLPSSHQRNISPSLAATSPSCGVSADVVGYQISDEGKRHAVYEVLVRSYFADHSGNEGEPKNTRIFRRYRDFLKLYEDLCKKYPAVENLKFPPKKASNLEEKVLIKRKEQLGVFLQELLSPEILTANPGLLRVVYQFLSNDHSCPSLLETFGLNSTRRSKMDRSNRGSKGGNRGVDESSERSGSTAANDALCSLDESKEIGSKNRGFIRSYSNKHNSMQPQLMQQSLSDQELAPETMKQLIDLFFEIFDVKAGGGGDWNVVRQQLALAISKVLKATFGDRINRKIVKLVSSYMTEESICGYIANLREYFWPQGHKTAAGEPKSIHEKYRTKFLAKVKLYGSISGEIKSLPFVTQDVTKRGILRFMKLAQDEQLNRRLAVVLFEELLSTLFPDLKFNDIFNEIYQKSDRIRNINSAERK